MDRLERISPAVVLKIVHSTMVMMTMKEEKEGKEDDNNNNNNRKREEDKKRKLKSLPGYRGRKQKNKTEVQNLTYLEIQNMLK